MMLLEPLRWIVGRGVLAYEKMTSPPLPDLTPEQQAMLDAQTTGIALYEFPACPFCMKVRKEIRKNGLKIERRDARRNPSWGDELRSEGGRYQTPCLKITDSDGMVQWLYESSDIVTWLDKHIQKA